VSFIETGRSNPSRAVLLRLAEILEIPFRDQNVLFEAAGYARFYSESTLRKGEVDRVSPHLVRQVLDLILKQHEPFSAVAVDRLWNVVMSNTPHRRILSMLLDVELDHIDQPMNLLKLIFDPDGLRPFLVNWPEVTRVMLSRLHREVASTRDGKAAALLEELLRYPDVPSRWQEPCLSGPSELLLPVHLKKGPIELRLFSTITTLGTPQDVLLQELRIEAFYPADSASEKTLREMHDHHEADSRTESPISRA
jgi:transcriptional regulator with XRE-family HTH domain